MRSSGHRGMARASFILTAAVLILLLSGAMLNATGLFAADRAVSDRMIQAVGMVPLACYCVAIGLIARAFATLARGAAVERVVARLLVRVGACLVVGGAFRVVGEPWLTRMILDRPWPYAYFDGAAVALAVLGLLLILLAGPLRDAARMRADLNGIL